MTKYRPSAPIYTLLTCWLAVAPAHAGGLPSPGIPQSCGINIHYRPIPATVLARMGDTRYGIMRTDLKWNQVESTPGIYDFSIWDKMTDQIISVGARPLYTIDYGNPLYDPDADAHAKITGPPAPPRTAEAVAAYAKCAAAAVAHFKGKPIIWEIYNEPDVTQFWKPASNADEYAAMAVAAAKEMREADPNACIIAPALGGSDFSFLKPAFRLGILKYIDAVSWHPYRRSAPETVAPQHDELHKLIAQYTLPGDPVRPVIASEWGYATTAKWKIDEAQQARYMIREYLADLAFGIDFTIFYDLRDDGLDKADQEANFGTLHHDYSPKPSGTAAHEFFAALDGYAFAHRLSGATPDEWQLLMCKGTSLAIVSWSTSRTATDAEATPSIRFVSPSDADYANLLRVASIGYHAGLQAFTVLAPTRPQITIANQEAVPATIQIAVGSSSTTLTVDPGKSAVLASNPFAAMQAGDVLSAPVSVTWNGVPVTGLPAIDAEAADLVNFSLAPRSDGFELTAETYVQPFNGAFRVETPAGTKQVPVSLDAYQTKIISIPGNPETTVQISAIDDRGHLIAQSHKLKYVWLPGMPHTPSDASGFTARPMPMNKPAPDQATTVVAAGDGAPGLAAIDFPYGTSPTWLYTLLHPRFQMRVPDRATEIVLWVKSTGDKCTMNSRYNDATGQTFQPSMGAMDYDGWRAQHLTFTKQIYSWGGASDGIQHPPLTVDAIFSIDGTRHPDGINHAFVGPGYFVIDEGK